MIINFINPPSSGGSGGSDPTKLPLAGGIMNTNASVSFTADVFPETPFLNFNVHTEDEYANFYGSISAGGLNFNDNNNDQRAVTLGYYSGLNCSNIDGLSSSLNVSGLNVTQLDYNPDYDIYYQKILTANSDGVSTYYNDGNNDIGFLINSSGVTFGYTDNYVFLNSNGLYFSNNGNLPDFRVNKDGIGVYANYEYNWSFGVGGATFTNGVTLSEPSAGSSGLSGSGNIAHSDYPEEIQLTLNGTTYAIPARMI